MTTTLNSSRGRGLGSQLALDLREFMSDAEMKIGQALPTVRELAERFAVTPATIREALRQLQATDTIVFRHGSGIYVSDGFHRSVIANPSSDPLTADGVTDLLQARLVLEPGIAGMAAVSRTDDHLASLGGALKTALAPSVDTHTHSNFHRELALSTGNRAIAEVIDSLLSVRHREQKLLRGTITDRDQDHADHVEIFNAVRDGDAAAATEATRVHLSRLNDLFARATKANS